MAERADGIWFEQVIVAVICCRDGLVIINRSEPFLFLRNLSSGTSLKVLDSRHSYTSQENGISGVSTRATLWLGNAAQIVQRFAQDVHRTEVI